jgi:hypothetical protein
MDTPTGPRGEWNRCLPWIEAALDRTGGTHDAADVLDAVNRGDMQFWPGRACALVTELIRYPRLLACNYFLVGGDMAELLEMQASVEAWARTQGCTRMQCAGRFGWRRVLKGWSEFCVVMTKEID